MTYHNHNDDHDTRTEAKAKAGAAGAGIGIGAIILIVILAVGGYFLLNGKNDTPASAGADVGQATSTAVEGTKDVLKEVPQAGSDAVTAGDQPTTRPNADGSTDKLDQK